MELRTFECHGLSFGVSVTTSALPSLAIFPHLEPRLAPSSFISVEQNRSQPQVGSYKQ
jgi:hypothetical protein